MGLLWRLLAPKPLKRARRSVRKVAHPVRTLTPKPIKKVKRTAYVATHPVSAAGHAVERGLLDGLTRSKPKRRKSTRKRAARTASPVVAANGATSAEVRAWARRNGHAVADKGRIPAAVLVAYQHANPR